MRYGPRLLSGMLATIVAVGTAMFYDEQREFDEALQALLEEQIALATALGADAERRIEKLSTEPDGPAIEQSSDRIVPRLLRGAAELAQPNSRVILVVTPNSPGLLTSEGQRLESPVLRAAVMSGEPHIVLRREHGHELGLPERIVVAGLHRIRDTRGRAWGVVVAASAERLRTRERHAQIRFLLGLGIATLVVGGFGALALRDQRRKLAIRQQAAMDAFQRDREKLLTQADKMATLAALSSGVAHQLATPLGTITARVDQVLGVVAHDARASAALQIVHDQVQRIEQTIRGLLDLARGNRPSLTITRPEAVAEAALEAVRHRFVGAQVALDLRCAAELPAIACDPPILEQALVNLLLNALEASVAELRVELAIEARDGRVQFLVCDEGEGITEEAAARVGEPFYTTKATAQGTGLGLSIAREIVENHRGTLTVARREQQRGTLATIALPAS